ncbi:MULTISPECIES: helix-turn-helix transcriptional regulator [unclassified Streptomyces]|uniref:helix-turn-helix domain-containing protein n=1 Tax=unclassified Streptomyces TaxID=2593676 RepID=UPI00278BC031|nr:MULTISPECIES: helix-turn-helix transcriptional regulator [unclassified Streptomyces]
MPRRRQVTARRARLGTELRRLREAAGLTAREAAALLGADSVQMSQIESGVAGVSEERLRRLAANYACSDGELIEALVAMATSRTRGWWEEYRGVLPVPFLDLSELDHYATFRHEVAVIHVPGLLQTEAYARALFAYMSPELPKSELELWVEHRMRRRSVIEAPSPAPYTTVIHEAALRIRVGSREDSRAQLLRILEAAEADHVTVRVVPFDLDCFAGGGSTMMYLGGAVPRLDTVVRDAPHGTALMDAEAQLGHFRTLFRKVEDASLDATKSRDFVHQLTKEL